MRTQRTPLRSVAALLLAAAVVLTAQPRTHAASWSSPGTSVAAVTHAAGAAGVADVRVRVGIGVGSTHGLHYHRYNSHYGLHHRHHWRHHRHFSVQRYRSRSLSCYSSYVPRYRYPSPSSTYVLVVPPSTSPRSVPLHVPERLGEHAPTSGEYHAWQRRVQQEALAGERESSVEPRRAPSVPNPEATRAYELQQQITRERLARLNGGSGGSGVDREPRDENGVPDDPRERRSVERAERAAAASLAADASAASAAEADQAAAATRDALSPAWRAIAEADHERAERLFRVLARRANADPMDRVGYALAAAALGRDRAALHALGQALATDPLAIGYLPDDSALDAALARLANHLARRLDGFGVDASSPSAETAANLRVLLAVVRSLRHDRAAAEVDLDRAASAGADGKLVNAARQAIGA